MVLLHEEDPELEEFRRLHGLLEQSRYGQIISVVNQQQSPSDQALILKMSALIFEGDFKKATSIAILLSKSENPWIVVQALEGLSSVNWLTENLNKAVEFVEQSSKILGELEANSYREQKIEALILHNFGTVKLFSGELTVAHDALKKSLRISSRLSDDFRISASTANLANLMNYQGQLDKSQELFMQALQIAKKVNNRSSQAVILTNLAIGYYQGGDIKKAIEFMLESIKIAKTVGNHVRVIESMPYLLEFQLEIGDRTGAKSTVDEINEIQQNYPELDHFLVYSRALFLKYGHRLRDKIQATALFENYLGGGNKTFEHEMNAHLHLCELIFDELVLYSHIDVKNEINDHLNKAYQISQKNHLFSEIIRILILRGKMMLLDFEFEKAHNTFEQAVIYAEETGIEYLNIKARQEQELLQRNLDEWEEMVRRGSPIRNRAEKAKIKDYIDQVIKRKVP